MQMISQERFIPQRGKVLISGRLCIPNLEQSACISANASKPKSRLQTVFLGLDTSSIAIVTETMPHKTSSTKSQTSKAERARQILSGGGVIREDSDDELGFDDLPWEWIYSEDNNSDDEVQDIAGARMGTFECMIGDCVLLKAEGTHEAWIGLICDFEEDEEEGKMANFMWFSTEREIRNKHKKRTDALPVGIDLSSREFEVDCWHRMRSTLLHHGI